MKCGEPAIWINPHGGAPGQPVHENIRIEDNYFAGCGIGARSVKGLFVTGNSFSSPSVPANVTDCQTTKIENNKTNVK